MATRTEIIAQIDDEIRRLERARDFLAAALTHSQSDSKAASAIALARKVKTRETKAATLRRKRTAVTATPVAAQGRATIVAPPPAPPKQEPQIQRVPPRRRIERRHLQPEKHVKPAAALSGFVPAGPVAVSADEARKVQERAAQPPPAPVANEPRPEVAGERTLGSLIQAFERRAGLSGIETT
jgi:hypothetical protein